MKKKDRKPWNEMNYRELDYDALIEHAISLGGEKALEALDYLKYLKSETVPFDREMKEERRKQLAKKMKRKNNMTTNIPLYTQEEIEEMLSGITEVPKYSALTLKQAYCEKYYPKIIPEKKKKDGPTFEDKIEEARAKILASMNK